MDNQQLQELTDALLNRIFLRLEASGRHVHVTKTQAVALFGHPLTPKRPLSQPGQYLANERVTVIGPKENLKMSPYWAPSGRKPRWKFPSPTPAPWV